jgi:hypothetical protein
MLQPLAGIGEELEQLAHDGFCANARAIAFANLELLLPPEDISTKECAEKHRYLPSSEGSVDAVEPRCTRCNKRLSRKTARLIDGKVLCSACVFPPLKKGLPS